MSPAPEWVVRFRAALAEWQNRDPQNMTQPPCFLATVEAGQFPKVRTVGHANLAYMSQYGFWAVIIGTDARSPKADHIKKNENVEICYWFDEAKEQFRISGKAFIVDSKSSDAVWLNERHKYFSTLKDIRKKQYGRPEGPGTPLADAVTSPVESEELGKEITALAHYALIVVHVTSCDLVSQKRMERLLWTEPEPSEGDEEDPWPMKELAI